MLDLISKSGWALAGVLLLFVGPLLAKVTQEFLKARVQLREIEARNERQRMSVQERNARYQRSEGLGDTNNTRPARASSIVDTNFDILEKYYNQTLAENRLLSRAAIGVALLGFFVILIGVGLAFAGYTSIGVVSSVAGLLAEAATVMFFNQLREQVRQVQDYHKKLISTQYLMTSIALTKELNGDRHDVEVIRIINNLLFLSNDLHGSKSDHLFDRTSLLIDHQEKEIDHQEKERERIATPSTQALDGGTVSEQPPNDQIVDGGAAPEQLPDNATAVDGAATEQLPDGHTAAERAAAQEPVQNS